MTCSNCEANVRSALQTLDYVRDTTVSRATETATITMNKNVSLSDLQNVLDDKYQLSTNRHNGMNEQAKS